MRFTDKLFVEGHWTLQVRNHGNVEGEAANQPGNGSREAHSVEYG